MTESKEALVLRVEQLKMVNSRDEQRICYMEKSIEDLEVLNYDQTHYFAIQAIEASIKFTKRQIELRTSDLEFLQERAAQL